MADLDGQTFGPAQERRTHAPIVWDDSLGEGSGKYATHSSILDLLKNPSAASQILQSGIIRLNPNNMLPDQSTLVRHEAIHQVLLKQLAGQIGLGPTRDLTTAPDEYGNLARSVQQVGAGDMRDEVPAYIGSGDPRIDAPAQFKTDYLNKIKASLQQLNPQLAQQFQQLSTVPSHPNPF